MAVSLSESPYSEFGFKALLPKASFLSVEDINVYKISPTWWIAGECPDWLVNKQRSLSRSKMEEIKTSDVIEHHTNNHANIQRKYKTASLIGKQHMSKLR